MFKQQHFQLRRRSLQISARISLEFVSAILRAEEIFLARKLRLEFMSPLFVNFHATNRIRRHDSSSREFCPSPSGSKAPSVLSLTQLTDSVHFPLQKNFPTRNPRRKFFYRNAPYTYARLM